MTVISSTVQFFYGVFLALEVALIGWFQLNIFRDCIKDIEATLGEFVELAEENSSEPFPLLERLRKYRANVDSLERINNAFILVGKIAFITVATCIMLLTCHAGFRTESIAPANLVDSLRCHTLHRFFSCGGTMMTFACLILIQIAVIIIGFVYIFWIKHVLKLQNEALNGIKPTPSLRKIPISVKK